MSYDEDEDLVMDGGLENEEEPLELPEEPLEDSDNDDYDPDNNFH